jgi:gluconolactonase
MEPSNENARYVLDGYNIIAMMIAYYAMFSLLPNDSGGRSPDMTNPILDFGIDPSALAYLGSGLQRPECILAEQDGTLWTADSRGGVVRLRHDGAQEIVTQKISGHFAKADSEASRYLTGTLPNGLAFARNGDILISNFGTDRLEVMRRSGESKVLADSIDGEAIGKVNFVLRDSKDRIWITISTRIQNWMHALRPDLPDGYIARYIDGTFRIVATGFHFTNEIRMDAKEEYMYVAETTGGYISRMRLREDGSLGDREIFGPSSLGKGAWPDGIAFDSYGNLWGTCVYSDKLWALTPQGRCSRKTVFRGSRNRGSPLRDWPRGRALDGQRDLRRTRSANLIHRLP